MAYVGQRAVHTVTLHEFSVFTPSPSATMKILETRVPTTKENMQTLVKILMDCPEMRDLLQQMPGTSNCKYEFPNEQLESIYKVQLWQRMDYPDDVIRDMLQQQPLMNAHFCIYTHLYRFSQRDVDFLQDGKAILELTKAAIWVSEILRSLAIYSSCLPVYLIPILLHGYPNRELLNRLVPGIFVFDMIYLIPELFPMCSKHDSCAKFCLNYQLPLVSRNRIFKLVGGILTLSSLSHVQMQLIFQHAKKLDPSSSVGSFQDFQAKANFLFEINTSSERYTLRREKIKEYLQPKSTGTSSGSIHQAQQQPQQHSFGAVSSSSTYSTYHGGSAVPLSSSSVISSSTSSLGSSGSTRPAFTAHFNQVVADYQQQTQTTTAAVSSSQASDPFSGGSSLFGGVGVGGISDRSSSKRRGRAFGDDEYLEQHEMVIKLAHKIFSHSPRKVMEFAELMKGINEHYQDISDQGLSKMDILDSLKTYPQEFAFSDGNMRVQYLC